MSDWTEYFEPAVLQILGSNEFNTPETHHFGQPFVSAYQLAVAVERAYPELCERHHRVVGVGTRNLETYIARQLSGCYKNDPDYPIEGAWLSATGLEPLTYLHDGEPIPAKANSQYASYSLFRLRQR